MTDRITVSASLTRHEANLLDILLRQMDFAKAKRPGARDVGVYLTLMQATLSSAIATFAASHSDEDVFPDLVLILQFAMHAMLDSPEADQVWSLAGSADIYSIPSRITSIAANASESEDKCVSEPPQPSMVDVAAQLQAFFDALPDFFKAPPK